MSTLDGNWQPEFIESVTKYCTVLRLWTQDDENWDFYCSLFRCDPPYLIKDWPVADDFEMNLIQKRFVTETVIREGYTNKDLYSKIHSGETFSSYVATAASELWREKLYASQLPGSLYLDSLIRKAFIRPLGLGIGHLCLSLAKETIMSEEMLDEIDTSRHLSPILPFTDEEKRSLIRMTCHESRLRLALAFGHSLSRCCSKLEVTIEAATFKRDFQQLMEKLILMDDLDLFSLINQELRIIFDALLLSRREESVSSTPPPSPRNETYEDDYIIEERI